MINICIIYSIPLYFPFDEVFKLWFAGGKNPKKYHMDSGLQTWCGPLTQYI